MITENGVVSDANGLTAWIKTIRSGACEGCSSKKSCGTVNNQKEQIVQVNNTLDVEKGDHVVIGLQSGPILYLTFLLYVFPIILMIIGALIGNTLAPTFDINPSILSMVLGFSFFGLAFYIIRKKNKSLEKRNEFKPFLVRKRSHVIPEGCSLP